MNVWPWIDELPKDSTDLSSDNEIPTSSCSLSSSSESQIEEAEEKEQFCPTESKYDVIHKQNLTLFVQKIDQFASLDDQAADLVSKCANAFVKDVSMRLIKLAKYRNSEPELLDLKFVLKREYNMEFPQ